MHPLELDRLKEAMEPVRKELLDHPVYRMTRDLDALRRFSEHHVYAVWDFMTLLKSLQRALTCIDLPWVPVGSAETRYLINEIVAGEESDIAPGGGRTSHYELYLAAMEQMGADTAGIRKLIGSLTPGQDPRAAIGNLDVDPRVRAFLSFTFDIALDAPLHARAAAFTFGREDLIPDMFTRMLEKLDRQHPGKLSLFQYYIERHIEVDGDHHSKLATRMVCELCGNDPVKWKEAQEAALGSLRARQGLWDAVIGTTIGSSEPVEAMAMS